MSPNLVFVSHGYEYLPQNGQNFNITRILLISDIVATSLIEIE